MDDDDTNRQLPPVGDAPQKRLPPAAGMGRIKGSQNKITKTLKEAVMESFDRVGGVEYLVKVAQDDPKSYVALLGRVIPLQVKAEIDHTVSGILFKTVYENDPEALPSPSMPIIEATVVEPVEVTPPASPSPPQP